MFSGQAYLLCWWSQALFWHMPGSSEVHQGGHCLPPVLTACVSALRGQHTSYVVFIHCQTWRGMELMRGVGWVAGAVQAQPSLIAHQTLLRTQQKTPINAPVQAWPSC